MSQNSTSSSLYFPQFKWFSRYSVGTAEKICTTPFDGSVVNYISRQRAAKHLADFVFGLFNLVDDAPVSKVNLYLVKEMKRLAAIIDSVNDEPPKIKFNASVPLHPNMSSSVAAVLCHKNKFFVDSAAK